jgi:hypothetical protein
LAALSSTEGPSVDDMTCLLVVVISCLSVCLCDKFNNKKKKKKKKKGKTMTDTNASNADKEVKTTDNVTRRQQHKEILFKLKTIAI